MCSVSQAETESARIPAGVDEEVDEVTTASVEVAGSRVVAERTSQLDGVPTGQAGRPTPVTFSQCTVPTLTTLPLLGACTSWPLPR